MVTEQPCVYLVDDDPAVRKTLPRGLRHYGFTVEAFESASHFLDNYNSDLPGCLVLDLSMPDMSGLELQQLLFDRNMSIPIIFITGHGDVPQSVQALRAGAIDFLEKPFLPSTLVKRIEEAFEQDRKTRQRQEKLQVIRERFDRLTDREQGILQLILQSKTALPSKEMARQLNISHRTIEHHRSRILEKTATKTISELKFLAARIGVITDSVD